MFLRYDRNIKKSSTGKKQEWETDSTKANQDTNLI